MSWSRIWVHLVFTTKNRDQILRENIRQNLFDHIKENAKAKEIYIDSIGGWLQKAFPSRYKGQIVTNNKSLYSN